MIKVKIFDSAQPKTLEDDVNEFIKDHTVVDIKYSLSFNEEYGNVGTCLIIYEDFKNN